MARCRLRAKRCPSWRASWPSRRRRCGSAMKRIPSDTVPTGARKELGRIAVIHGSRLGDHLLEGDGELVRTERTAFPHFLAWGYDSIPGINRHFISLSLVFLCAAVQSRLPSDSKLVTQQLNRRHSARITAKPVSIARREPSTTFSYRGIVLSIRLLGAVSLLSLMSSGGRVSCEFAGPDLPSTHRPSYFLCDETHRSQRATSRHRRSRVSRPFPTRVVPPRHFLRQTCRERGQAGLVSARLHFPAGGPQERC